MQVSVKRYIVLLHTYLHIYYSINILLRFYSKPKYPSLLNLASKYRYKSISIFSEFC